MKVPMILSSIVFAAVVQVGMANPAAAESELVVIVTPYLTAPAKRNSRATIRGFGKFSVSKRSTRRSQIKSYRSRHVGPHRRILR